MQAPGSTSKRPSSAHHALTATMYQPPQLTTAAPQFDEQYEQYDRRLLQAKTRHLEAIRATGNCRELMFALQNDLIRNIANIAKRCAGEGRRCWGVADVGAGSLRITAGV